MLELKTQKRKIIGILGIISKGLERELEDLEIGRRAETFQTTAVKIDQNTEKSLKDLGRLAFTQTPVKDHLLMLVFKYNNLFAHSYMVPSTCM